MTNELNDPIEIALAQGALDLAKLREKWTSIRDFFMPIIRAMQKLEIEPRLSGSIDLIFSGDQHKFAAVVRILRTRGFTTTTAPPMLGDTGWYGHYWHKDCETAVWVYFTSSVCTRVKVGTKMVAQDIYEVRCGNNVMAFQDIPKEAV